MNVYKMRISQAGIVEYTLIMLEMEKQWIEESLQAFEAGRTPLFVDCVTRAQAVQVELMNVMNMDNSVAVDIYAVFAYINKQLILAKIKQQPLELARCKELLERYHKSFAAIQDTDQAGPVMAQSEKVYAGLTYGTSGLVESSVGGTEYTV